MAEFEGNDRFEVVRRLGAGGMGVVHEVLDRERDTHVALKTIRQLNASLLYRFKKEFRALADLNHPNLVRLHELISDGEVWFYTMELVQGSGFMQYVRGPGHEADSLAPTEVFSFADSAVPTPAPGSDASAGVQPPLDSGRLRAALGQLVRGVHALHQDGKIHRDIKPSNVMVTHEGRVVLLDFGIIAEQSQTEYQSTGAGIVGTAAYMAPEQAAGDAATPAADWYAVGALLFEALTGRLPFAGTPLQVLLEKQQRDPPAPSSVVQRVDRDLDELCVALLRRDPLARPDVDHIMARLGLASGPVSGDEDQTPSSTGAPIFIGRQAETRRLLQLYLGACHGDGRVALVAGETGIGKSRLVRHTLSELRRTPESTVPTPLVLAGRCLRRESVPYKALDSIVDALSHVLVGLSRGARSSLLPDGGAILGRLFPVLRRVPGLAGGPGEDADVRDPQELRARGFAALRELLARLAARQPLVLFIDDLHWADEDSVELLRDLLRPPLPRSMVLMACYRPDRLEERAMWRGPLEELRGRADVEEIELGPLTAVEVAALVEQFLPGGEVDSGGDGSWREARGNPFVISELCRVLQGSGEGEEHPTGLDLEGALRARIDGLDDASKEAMELLSVAGGPIPAEVVSRALETDPRAVHGTLAALRTARLVRQVDVRGAECVEVYHERIRGTVLGGLDGGQVRAWHGAPAGRRATPCGDRGPSSC